MKRHVLLLFWLVIQAIALTSSDKAMEGKLLIEQAEAKTDIFALPSFEMKAKVRIENRGKPLDGAYLLLWNGPEQWREEISFQGYSEVQVGGKGVVFLKRSTEVIPERIDQLHATLGYGSGERQSFVHVTLRSDETVKKIKSRKTNVSKADCVEISGRHDHTREVCIDESTGVLVRQDPFLDRELMPVATKLFPRFLSYVADGKSLAEIQVTELKETDQWLPSVFEPPPSAVSKPGCMNPNPTRPIKRVMPQYPEQERRSRVEGTVLINAFIGKDGTVRELRIISGTTPEMNKVSLDAVQQWRYEPATCSGVPSGHNCQLPPRLLKLFGPRWSN